MGWGLCKWKVIFILLSIALTTKASADPTQYVQSLLEEIQQGPCDHFDCYYFRQNLKRDTNTCLIDAEQAFATPHLVSPKIIKGAIRYSGLWSGRYQYRVFANPTGKYDIVVKVHFAYNSQEVSAIDLWFLRDNFFLASKYWTENSPSKLYQFQFIIVENPKEADFSVKLVKRDVRGPYYSKWSASWPAEIITHELGHMLGLDDEYGTIRQHRQCHSNHIMCSPFGHAAKPYLFYQIFKRIHCQK